MATLAGCGSEYDSNEVKIKKEGDSEYAVLFTEKASGKLITGTIIDKSGDRVFWTAEVVDGKPDGEWIRYYDDGSVVSSATLKDGEPVGPVTEYCDPYQAKGKTRSITDYASTAIKHQIFHCNAEVMVEEFLTDKTTGKRIGESKEWKVVNSEQMLKEVENYNSEGIKHGITESYLDDGRLMSSVTYRNGEIDGPYKRYVLNDKQEYRLSVDGVYKGSWLVEGKSYQTHSSYPDGTLKEQVIALGGGGYATLIFEFDGVVTRVREGKDDAVNERMIMGKVTDNPTPSQADLDKIAAIVKSTKADLNKAYGQAFIVDGDHLITTMAEGYYETLVGLGLDPHGTDFDGSTRLMNCMKSRNNKCSADHMIRLAKDTLTAGVKSKHVFGETAASMFCHSTLRMDDAKKYELFSVLLKMDDINKVNNAGLTPLHQCAKSHDFTAFKMLVDAGANLEAKSNKGFTPLEMAFVTERLNETGISWDENLVKTVGDIAKGTTFSFHKPIPVFNESLKSIFMSRNDADSALVTDAYN